MIKENKIDGYVNTNLVVMAYPMMDDELEITHKKIGNNMFLSPGVKKGNKELIKAINEAMFELSKAGYFRQIYEDSFGKFYKDITVAEDFLLEDLYSSF